MRGIPIFPIFAPKHRLWVLVRTAAARRLPTIYVLSINKKNIKMFPMKFLFFAFETKNICILHGQVFVMQCGDEIIPHGFTMELHIL